MGDILARVKLDTPTRQVTAYDEQSVRTRLEESQHPDDVRRDRRGSNESVGIGISEEINVYRPIGFGAS